MTITRRLLIVDDEDMVIRILHKYFTKLGWEVVTASNGAAALKAFEADQFHVLLSGVNLGDEIDGIEVARRLLDQHPHLKVVMMSGQPENEHRVTEAKVGVFVPKPFDLESLCNILNAQLA